MPKCLICNSSNNTTEQSSSFLNDKNVENNIENDIENTFTLYKDIEYIHNYCF